MAQLVDAEARLLQLTAAVAEQRDETNRLGGEIKATTAKASEAMEAEWQATLQAWEADRKTASAEHQTAATTQLGLLAGAVAIGNQMLERSAGNYASVRWVDRAARERRLGTRLRWLTVAVAVVAAVLMAWFLALTIENSATLGWGEAILRTSLVLLLGGIAAFVGAESRRHFKEADSAEEITISLQSLEPFFARGGEELRSLRRELGDAVFVRNVMSRLAQRDASKHNDGLTPEKLDELVKLLDTAIRAAKTPAT